MMLINDCDGGHTGRTLHYFAFDNNNNLDNNINLIQVILSYPIYFSYATSTSTTTTTTRALHRPARLYDFIINQFSALHHQHNFSFHHRPSSLAVFIALRSQSNPLMILS
eukprot:2555486-Amphidinium_carterae.2